MMRLLLILMISISLPVFADERRYQPAELRADIESLHNGLREAQYDPYHQITAAELDQEYAHYVDRLNRPMNLREASALFQQFTALTKTAHTRIEFPIELYRRHLGEGGKTLPLYLTINQDAVLVDEYYGEAPLRNTQVLRVNGQPVHEWLEPYHRLISADNERLSNVMLGMQMPGILWWHDGEQEDYSFEVLDLNGELLQVTVSTSAVDQQEPFHEGDSGESLRSYEVLSDRYGYLKPGPFYNAEGENPWDASAFKNWIDDAFGAFSTSQVDTVIIDLRDNPGGTNSFSDYMIAWFADEPFKFASNFKVKVSAQAANANRDRLELTTDETSVSYRYQVFFDEHENGDVFSFPLEDTDPLADRHFDGEVIVLVNRFSFSNAVSVAAIVQDYGFGTVVGEETADLATTYGAMEQFTLPNTGLVVGFPKALIIRPNGDATPAGVAPDVVIEADDEMLNDVIRWLEQR